MRACMSASPHSARMPAPWCSAKSTRKARGKLSKSLDPQEIFFSWLAQNPAPVAPNLVPGGKK